MENVQQIMENGNLDLVFKETLRMWNPTLASFWRVCLKPMEICGIVLPKGTVLLPPTGWNRLNPLFKDGAKFRPERFVEEMPKVMKEHRYSHIPFYAGKRGCPGYRLGELMMKMEVAYTLKIFELENRQEEEITMHTEMIYGVTKPTIGFRLK